MAAAFLPIRQARRPSRSSSCVAGRSVAAAAVLPISKPRALRGGLWQRGRSVARRSSCVAGGLWRRRFCQSASRSCVAGRSVAAAAFLPSSCVAGRSVVGAAAVDRTSVVCGCWRAGSGCRRATRRRSEPATRLGCRSADFCARHTPSARPEVVALRGRSVAAGRLLSTAQAYCPAAGNRESVAGGPR